VGKPVKKKSKAKPKNPSVALTLWDVILSYPDLHEPKPYMGKIRYRTDVLLDSDHADLSALKKAVSKVRVTSFGDDKTEWPKGAKKKLIHDGNEREDQKTYKDRFYITAGSNNPVPIVDLKGKTVPAQQIRGGMMANVAVTVGKYNFEGKEGVTIYLNGIQLDPAKKVLPGFGGGPSVEKMFGKRAEDQDDDAQDFPRGKKKPLKKKKTLLKKGKKKKASQEEE
jgi:hypothetical protein